MSTPTAGQRWDADGYARDAAFVPALGATILEALAPCADEAILDVGCGDGALTERIAEIGARVTGLEPDPSLAARARERGLDVIEHDAHEPFGEGVFDALFSNAALHWMRDPALVLANAHAALRPGGRLVAEQGGFGNVAAVVTALVASLEAIGREAPREGPWDFPTVDAQRARLVDAGFAVRRIALVPRQTPLPSGIDGWLATFAGPFVDSLSASERRTVLADTARRLAPRLRDERGGWHADYVRLRFVATR